MAVVQSSGGVLDTAQQPWTSYGSPGISKGLELFTNGDFFDYAAIYRTQPNVRLVIAFLARNIAQLGIKAYTAVEEDKRETLARAHPLARLLRRPNPYTTKHRFVDALVHDRKIFDNFFALKLRNPVTGQLNLFRIPPQMIEPIGGSWLRPEGWRLLGNKARPEFPVDAVLHLRGFNPDDPRLGNSPLESLRRVLAEERAAGEWREQYWRGAARISGVIERPLEAPKWKDPALNRFRAEWQSTWTGNSALAGATPILEEGMQYKEAAFSPKDSEYLGARRLAREEVAAAFFVSPLFVGILENANFSNVAEQHKHLYQDTLGPDLDEFEEDLALQLLDEFPDLDPDETYFEFNLAEKLKGSFEEQAASLQTSVGAPWLTRNEARARQNLPPVDGGDALVTPLNVLTGGQASPRDTAPPPGSASRAELGSGRKALGSGRKAVEDLPTDVHGWHAKHLEILGAFFSRQSAAVSSRLGAGQSVDEAFDLNRWNEELTTDLKALAFSMAEEIGTAQAETFGATYDAALAEAWLSENARIAAESVNGATRSAVWLAVHHGGAASRSSDRKDALELDAAPELDVPGPLEEVASIFALLQGARAEEIATTRVTSISSFARHEGASQAGVPFKVWRVRSAHSRHPGMNGQKVRLGHRFSNGGRWPGDPALGADEIAGCTCSLDFATEE